MAISREEKQIILRAVKEGRGIEETLDGLKKIQGQSTETGGAVKGMAGWFSALLPALSTAAIIASLKAITDAAIESDRESRILSQTIKNLGLENQITTAQVEAFAESLQRLAGVSDEDVIRSFNSLILITKDAKQAMELTKLAIEMASGSGKSLGEASDAIRMALMGATRGLKNFNIEVKEGEPLVDSLRKAVTNFRGQTEKLGETTEGSIKRSMQSFDNLKETAGRTLLPIIGFFAQIADVALQLVEVRLKEIIIGFREFGNVVAGVFNMIIKRDFKELQKALDENAKLDKERLDLYVNYYKKQTEKKKEIELDFEVFKGVRAAKDEKAEEEKAKKEQERLEKEAAAKKKAADDLADYEYEVAKEKYEKIVEEEDAAAEKLIESNRRIGESFRDDVVDQMVNGSLDIQKAINDLAAALLKTLLQDALIPVGQAAAEMGGSLRKAITGGSPSGTPSDVAGKAGAVVGGTEAIGLGAATGLLLPLSAALALMAMTGPGGKSFSDWSKETGIEQSALETKTFAMIMAAGKSFAEVNLQDWIPKAVAEIAKSAAQEGSMNDFISRPGQKAQKFSPDDTIVGIKDLSKLTGNKTEIHIHVGAMMGTPADALAFAKMVDVQLRKISRRDLTV